MQQSVDAGQDLHERTEVGDPLDLPKVRLVQLGAGRQLLDDGDGLLGRVAVRRGDVDAPVVLDVDLHAGPVHNAANRLAAGSDDVADLVDGDGDRHDPRCVGRNGIARSCNGRLHLFQNRQTARPRLRERLAHDRRGHAGHLDVHLQGGNAVRRAGHLEVHVPVVVLGAGDVGQDGVAAAAFLHDESHRHAGHRRLERHAGIHQRQSRPADRGHRRRSVRFEDVGDNA